jgi:hypothetical protein
MNAVRSTLQKGYLALEFSVYFFLTVLMVMLTLEWAVAYYAQCTARVTQNVQEQEISGAHSVLERDLYQACHYVQNWKKISGHECIWTVQDKDIGWCIKDQSLVRMQGSYNAHAGRWHAYTTALIAQCVQDIMFIPVYVLEKQIAKMTYILHDKCGKRHEGVVYMRNGNLA